MDGTVKTLGKYLLAIAAIACLFCAKVPDDNPLWSGYRGDYRLGPAWSALPDTLEVFRVYTFPCTTGVDTFAAFSGDGSIDSLRTLEAYRYGRDSLAVYFVAPLSGALELCGIRPNFKTVCATAPGLTVVNPYVLHVDTLVGAGEIVEARAAREDGGPVGESLRVVWSLDSAGGDTLPATSAYTFTAAAQGTQAVGAVLIDAYGNALSLGSRVVRTAGARPGIAAVLLPETIRLGDTLAFTMVVDTADSALSPVWALVAADTLVNGASFPVANKTIHVRAAGPVADTGRVDIAIWYALKNGLTSTRWTAVDTVRYVLPVAAFSDSEIEIPVGDSVTVRVYDTTHTAATFSWLSAVHGALDGDADSVRVFYPTEGSDTITVCAQDRFGYRGPVSRAYVTARVFEYTLEIAAPAAKEVLAGRWASLAASVRAGTTPITTGVSYHWTHAEADSADTNGATLSVKSLSPRAVNANVYAVVNAGDTTNTAGRALVFLEHRPVVRFGAARYEAPINSAVACSVTAADTNSGGAIAAIRYRLDNGAEEDSGASATVWRRTFAAPGSHALYAWAVDNDGFVSDTDSAVVLATSDAPMVTGLDYAGPVIKGVSVTLTVSVATSTNGAPIEVYYWDFDGDTSAGWDETSAGAAKDHAFSAAGTATVWVKVRDGFDAYSGVGKYAVVVEAGAPVLGAVALDTTAGNVFVADARRYGFSANDPNGTLSALYCDIDGRETYSFTASSASLDSAFHHAFAVADSGVHEVRVRARDNEGLCDTAVMVVAARAGTPVVDSLTLFRPDSLFIKDQRNYRIYGRDTNSVSGLTYYYDVDNDGSWDGSSGDGNFSYAYVSSGTKTMRLGYEDEDGLVGTKTVDLNVRLGAPVLWGDSGDTLWVVIDRGAGIDYHIHVNNYDTNGVIQKFFWNESGEGIGGADSTTVDSFPRRIGVNDVNHIIPMWIYGRDDDGLVGGNVTGNGFVVFADSAPPAASIVSPTNSVPFIGHVDDSVTLTWYGLDTHDSLQTQFQISIVSPSAQETVVQPYQAASSFSHALAGGHEEITFTYKHTYGTGVFDWKVKSLDARGSLSTQIQTGGIAISP
jgi:hypothetical protein